MTRTKMHEEWFDRETSKKRVSHASNSNVSRFDEWEKKKLLIINKQHKNECTRKKYVIFPKADNTQI